MYVFEYVGGIRRLKVGRNLTLFLGEGKRLLITYAKLSFLFSGVCLMLIFS